MSDEAIGKALGWKSGAAWTAQCPSRGDGERGRSVAEADNGKLPVHLHGSRRGVAAPTVATTDGRIFGEIASLRTWCGAR